MKKAIGSQSKNKEHSDKLCVCGGHSSRDKKKNKKYNSTKTKIERRKERKFKFTQLSKEEVEADRSSAYKYLFE